MNAEMKQVEQQLQSTLLKQVQPFFPLFCEIFVGPTIVEHDSTFVTPSDV